MSTSARCLLVLLALAPAACDTKAQPAAASNGVPDDPDLLSAEHESCGRTADCAEGLRCFEQTCARIDRSLLGDYHAALGARRQAAGDLPGALEAFGEAQKRYGLVNLTVPVDIECGYGAALATDDKQLELAAKVLYRCVKMSPAGSGLRARALATMSALQAAGLDPEHLDRETPADVFLSRGPAAPAKPVEIAITVTAAPEPKKGWPELQASIKAAAGLQACFDAAFAATKATSLTVGVPFKSVYKTDPDYPDDGGKWVTGVDPKAPAPANDAERCVRDAVTAATKGMKAISDWDATVTVAIQ